MGKKIKPLSELKPSPTLERQAKQIQIEQKIEENMAKIHHKIAVISGKGGVGKTTTAANLALFLAGKNETVGVLDVDITGPNMPKFLGISDRPEIDPQDQSIIPVKGPLNTSVMSMAFLLDSDQTPVIWRGPMKMSIIREFLGSVAWGPLEYMIVDLPPGTGDETLDIMQLVKNLDGVIVVTTSQDMSLINVAKTISMAMKMDVKVLGIIENMSSYRCPNCRQDSYIFGKEGAAKALAGQFQVPFLGSVPLDPIGMQYGCREDAQEQGPAKAAFESIFENIYVKLQGTS
ncbi:MAG TPA: Mrp/NBP35 family ATP-binding protein [Candidatus Lokiarchaeia archaeon]|nr:Mrp/NBP35 family ATP-binding protein [Candidatus Lokiarchaeia archaeon]